MDEEFLLDTGFDKGKQPPKEPHLEYAAALAVRFICRDCRNDPPNLIEEYQDGDIICGDCGMVRGDRTIDIRNEWRTFGKDDDGMDPSRVGTPIDDVIKGVEDLDLSTRIGFLDGRTGLSRELQRKKFRVKGGKSDRSLPNAFRSIGQICYKMSLPKTVVDIAKQTYKRVYQEKLLPKKDLPAILAACVFIACRQGRVARTFFEISKQTHVPKKSLGQCYKAMEKAFKLTMGGASSGSEILNKVASGPETLLVRYCNHLNLPTYVESAAATVIKEARRYCIGGGRSPISIAAAAIYLTSHLYGVGRSVKSICEVVGGTEATVKTVYKIYYDNKEKLVKQEWLKSGGAKLELLPK